MGCCCSRKKNEYIVKKRIPISPDITPRLYPIINDTKILSNGPNICVYLISNMIIRKEFKISDEGIGLFKNELTSYKNFSKYNFVTKIFNVDYTKQEIYLPYHEDKIEYDSSLNKWLETILSIIKTDYSIKPLLNYDKSNIVKSDNNYFLIGLSKIPWFHYPLKNEWIIFKKHHQN